MRFRNQNQRKAVMARLKKAGFSKTSSLYILKRTSPVSVTRENKDFVVVMSKNKSHIIPKRPVYETSEFWRSIDRYRKIKGYDR